MADLLLSGTLNLIGPLNLNIDSGGKVMAGGNEVLVVGAQGNGVPVLLPPPNGTPQTSKPAVKVETSFNTNVQAYGKNIVALGLCIQSDTWPGMVLTSTQNSFVKINQIPINVIGDAGITFPNGGTITFDGPSGQ